MSVGAICGIPLEVVKTERVEARWCFGERTRLAGTWTLSGPSFETLMATGAWGWAEPVWTYYPACWTWWRRRGRCWNDLR